MIKYEDALKIIYNCSTPMNTTSTTLLDSVGEIAAQYINAGINIPPFNNSAMDGYAVNSKAISSGNNIAPIKLEIIGSVAAGDTPPKISVNETTCYEIMTGAPLAPGSDAVVRLEDVQKGDDGKIIISKEIRHLENVRCEGEDFNKDSVILSPGEKISSEHIMALSSVGVSRVVTFRRPKIALITTGAELLPFDVLQNIELPPGKIRNSNSPYLISRLKSLGVDYCDFGTIKDNEREFLLKLDEVLEYSPDIIITTGAVSKGRHDFIPNSIERFGGKILFHEVAIRPGKPILVATLGDKPGAPLLFALPGNPISTAVGLRFFVEPYIKSIRVEKNEDGITAFLDSSIVKKRSLLCFYKSILYFENEVAKLNVLKGQPSFMISPLLQANAWGLLPEGVEEFEEGEIIKVFPLHSEWLKYPYNKNELKDSSFFEARQ